MAERTIKIRFDGSARGLEKAANKAARQLDQFGDQAEKALGQAGDRSASSFTSSFDDIVGRLAGIASQAARAFGPTLIAAMPAIAATAGLALTAGFGAAIVGIGLAAVAQTDRVQAAFDDMVSDVKSTLARIAAPLEGVIANAMSTVRELVDFFAPAFRSAFESISPVLNGFIDNVASAFKQLRPAIEPAVDAFGVIIDSIGAVLPDIMRSISDSIIEIAGVISRNRGKIMALVDAFAKLVQLGAKFASWGAKLTNAFFNLVPGFNAYATKARLSAKATNEFGKQQRQAAREIDSVTQSLKKQVEQIRKATNPVFRLTSAIRNVDKAQTAYNEAVRKYGPESAQARDASLRLAKAVADAEAAANNGELSFDAFQRKLDQWTRQGVITEAQARDIAARVRDARDAAGSFAGSYTATLNLIDNVSWKLNNIGNRLSSMGTTWVNMFGGGRASGGDVQAGTTYLVGERGPELLTMGASSGHITPNHELAAGGGPGVLEAHIEIGGEVVRVVRTELREMKRGVRRSALAGGGAT